MENRKHFLKPTINTHPFNEKPAILKMSRFICLLFKNIMSTGDPSILPHQLTLPPPDSIVLFLERILQGTSLEIPVVLLSLFYLKKLHTINPGISILSPKQKLLTFSVSLMLAQKFTNDHPLTQSEWARLIGIDVQILSSTELSILNQLEYSLSAPLKEYAQFCQLVRLQAKKWNSIASLNSPYPQLTPLSNVLSPNSDSPATPATPTHGIPAIISSIESVMKRKRSFGNESFYEETVFKYPMATPSMLSPPRFPHSILN